MSLMDLEETVVQAEEYAQLLEEFYDKLLEALLIETRIGSPAACGNLAKMAAHVKECRDIARRRVRRNREQHTLFTALYAEIENKTNNHS